MSIHRYEFVPDVSTFFVPLYRQSYINCRHTGSYLYIDKLLFRHTGSYLYRQTTISTTVDISVRRHTGSYLYIDKPLYRQLSIYRYVDIAVRRHSGWTPNTLTLKPSKTKKHFLLLYLSYIMLFEFYFIISLPCKVHLEQKKIQRNY